MKCSVPGSSVHGDSPGKNTGVDCHAFIQGIFPIQGSFPIQGWSPRLLHWQAGFFATSATYRKRWARTKTQTGCWLFSLEVVSGSLPPHASRHASLSFIISQSLLKLMSIESVMPSNHLIFCHLLLLLPSTFPSIWVFSSESALPSKVRKLQLQHQFFQRIFSCFPLGMTGWIALLSKGLSRLFFITTVWKHQFFSVQPSSWSSSHIHTWLLEKP